MIAARVVLRGLQDERLELQHDLISARIRKDYAEETELERVIEDVDLRVAKLEGVLKRNPVPAQRESAPGLARVCAGLAVGISVAYGLPVVLLALSGALIGWGALAAFGGTK